MKKFSVKFIREFEVEVQAEDTATAKLMADAVIAQFPKDSCRLLSVVAEDALEECATCRDEGPIKPVDPPRRGGPPNLGGNPGGTVVKVPVLVDQIAEAA
jgi:hypothetical protein